MKAVPAINGLLQGPLKRYRGIEAATVARAMVNEIIELAENGSSLHGDFYRRYDDTVALGSSR